MKKIARRFLSVICALALCISTSVTSFAMEVEPMSNGDLLYSKSATFQSGSGVLEITTEKANLDAQYVVSILSGPDDAQYYVSMEAASGDSITFGWMKPDGKGKVATQKYSKKGTYKFYVTQTEGSYGPVTVLVQILD